MYSGTQNGAWKNRKVVVLGLGFDGQGAQCVQLSLIAKQILGNATWGNGWARMEYLQFSADVLQLILMIPHLAAFKFADVMTMSD